MNTQYDIIESHLDRISRFKGIFGTAQGDAKRLEMYCKLLLRELEPLTRK